MNLKQVTAIAVLAVLLFCTSCDRSENYEKLLKFSTATAKASIKDIERNSDMMVGGLQEKLTYPASFRWANIWNPKAQAIQLAANSFVSYLKVIKPGERGFANGLRDSLQVLKARLLGVDSVINKEFGNIIKAFPDYPDTSVSQAPFVETGLPELSKDQADAYITQLNFRVRSIENMLLRFCFEQVPKVSFLDPYPVFLQSSTVVGEGQEIEVIAGLGGFSRLGDPVITIEGQQVIFGGEGAAHYKFNASMKAGKYSLPVKMEFTQGGLRQVVEKQINYSVVRGL